MGNSSSSNGYPGNRRSSQSIVPGSSSRNTHGGTNRVLAGNTMPPNMPPTLPSDNHNRAGSAPLRQPAPLAPPLRGTRPNSSTGAAMTASSSANNRGGSTGSSMPSVRATSSSRPGAYSVSSGQGRGQVFRVMVPNNVQPGQEFQVYAGTRLVRVVCPPNIRGGQPLQLTVPAEPTVTPTQGIPPLAPTNVNNEAPVDMPEYLRRDIGDPDLQPSQGSGGGVGGDSDNRNNGGGYLVTIPPNVREGEQFPFVLNGRQLLITCPPGMTPGSRVRIHPPQETPEPAPRLPQTRPDMQLFEVIVPRGVRGGQPFALMAGQQRVLVTCPINAVPGQKIRFHLPTILTLPPKGVESIRLSYDKDGWARTIRVSDMKFQWTRFDQQGDVDQQTRFCAKTSAYVRRLDLKPGIDPRMISGSLTLVPASEAVVDSAIRGPQGRELVTYSDIASAQVKSFSEKSKWFNETCRKLRVEWDEGHMRINVRRDYLLSDSMMSVMTLSRRDLRKTWKFEFIGEEGIDAGGLAREWFQLVTEEIFNPGNGLWQQSAVNQMCMDINPASFLSHPEDHLVYFRFLGRVLAKALFDQQLVSGHMIRHLYKHLLGWPITFEDLEMVDDALYNSLKDVMRNADSVEGMCFAFTITENFMGEIKDVDLVKNGKNIDVTPDNLPEFIECRLKYAMLGRVKPQLTELLLGFFDVMEEPLLTIFDFQELELLMCGLPEIDTKDWQENTDYTGEFATLGNRHPVCRWFWEVVEGYDQEYRARLLQFVTGKHS